MSTAMPNPNQQPMQPTQQMPAAPQPAQHEKKKGGCLKWGAIGLGALFVIGLFASLGDDHDSTSTETTTTVSSESETATVDAQATSEPSVAPEATAAPAVPAVESPAQSAPDATREQRNALRSAENYLSFAGFSEPGLRDQLEFEGFPQDAIDYAIANVEVDWNKEALDSAKNYDSFASMSDTGLYDQLIFEGFTPEQAQYAIDNL